MLAAFGGDEAQWVTSQMFSLYLVLVSVSLHTYTMQEGERNLPIIFNGFDDKPQGRTDTVHVFIHDFLDDRGLPGIVQPAARRQNQACRLSLVTHSIRIRISLSLRRAFRRIDSIFEKSTLVVGKVRREEGRANEIQQHRPDHVVIGQAQHFIVPARC